MQNELQWKMSSPSGEICVIMTQISITSCQWHSQFEDYFFFRDFFLQFNCNPILMAHNFPSFSVFLSLSLSPLRTKKVYVVHLLKDINLNPIRNYEIKNRSSFHEGGDANWRLNLRSSQIAQRGKWHFFNLFLPFNFNYKSNGNFDGSRTGASMIILHRVSSEQSRWPLRWKRQSEKIKISIRLFSESQINYANDLHLIEQFF